MDYTLWRLPNGLRVVHHYDGSTAMVALDVLYNVGSRDEDPHLTGMAHLFEHLMFGGSENVPDYDGAVERAGGCNNAWTSDDFTNFYVCLPAVNAETAFYVESDRMLCPILSDKSLEIQRSVVLEEFKQVCLNKPYGDMSHRLRAMLYRTHPYRYPTIGKEMSHIERVTAADLREFFYSHYAPNNAVLAISGNITLDNARVLTDKWFGNLPMRDIKPREYAAEEPLAGALREEVRQDVPQTRIVIAFRMPGYGDPDYIAADIITDVLASGRSARFYRELVSGTNLFTHADACIAGTEEPGYLMLTGRLVGNGDDEVEAAEQALWSQIGRLVADGVDGHELNRALNRFESNYLFGQINYLDKAQALALSVMHGEDVNTIVQRYRSVSADMLHSAASRILRRENSATLIVRSN